MILSHSGIKSILPHRYPMLLVDAVIKMDTEKKSIVAIKAIASNEPCFSNLKDTLEHAKYSYPCSLMIESFSQSAGILYAWGIEAKTVQNNVMLFGSISGCRFYGKAFPGDTLEHHVQLERGLSDAAIFSGKILVNGETIVEIQRVVMALRPSEFLTTGQV